LFLVKAYSEHGLPARTSTFPREGTNGLDGPAVTFARAIPDPS
jgi:hypothetical protein